MTEPTVNPEQQAAITHGEGPLLIIAGAGTGKTTVVTERIKHLILEKKINPENILALTFTEKAATEMEERIDVAMPYGYTQMWIATFHAFCDRILRNESIHIGLNPAYKLMTEAEGVMFLRKNLYKLNLQYFRPLGNPYKFIQGLLQHFSRLKDEDITPEAYLEWAEKQNGQLKMDNGDESLAQKEEAKKNLELAQAYKMYEELKIKEGMMDFSDMIANTLKLFRTRPNVLKQYQDQFHYILIDEFQDTNFSQNQLAILLAGTRKNITVVGDDDQSIYAFRGSSVSNMMQFRTQFPDVKIVSLTKNYRSTANILDNAYKLIQFNNPDRLEIKENIDKKLVAMRNEAGAPVTLLFSDRAENEAEAVIKKIKELVKNLPAGKARKKYSYNDVAILVRANDHSQPFIRSLERNQIPYQFLGPGQLFHQEEIKDIIAYLKVLYNFEDNASLYRVISMPVFAIPARDIAAMLNYAKKTNMSLFEVLEQIAKVFVPDTTKEKVTDIAEMIKDHLSRITKESAGQILYHFLDQTGMMQTFVNPTTVEEEKITQNIVKFFEKLKTYEGQHEDASVTAVVDWIDLSMQMGESPLAADVDFLENNAVNILTVHSSKGLEFPVVFVTNVVSQRFPSRERREQIPIPQDMIKEILPEGDFHLQEERRLFYVAMTRARDYLFITAANFYGEGKRERKISPFVIEALGEDVVKLRKTISAAQGTQLSLLDMFPSEPEAVVVDTGLTKPKITYLSYSQIQTFDMCPLHYKLQYLLKVPSKTTSSLTFGTSVHGALKTFYEKHMFKDPVSIDHIEEILRANWINDGYTSKEHEKEAFTKAVGVLKNYLYKHFTPESLPIAVETPFIFPVKGLKAGGRIDRVDRLPDGRIEIIDYKTGANMPSERELLTNFQLTLYALAANQVRDAILNRRPEDVVLSLHYVETDTILTTTRTMDQLEEAKETLLQKAEQIANSDFICSKNMFCLNCEYKMLCNAH